MILDIYIYYFLHKYHKYTFTNNDFVRILDKKTLSLNDIKLFWEKFKV